MKNSNLSILIVEDDFISLSYLKDILTKLGFEKMYDAKNSDDAKKITANHNISLVFMDINIEGLNDGISCAKIINKEKDIPIIYTTAYADNKTIRDTKETNIFGYIIKPFSYEDVDSTLNVALRFLEKEVDEEESILDELILSNSYKFNFNTKTLKRNGSVINLTKKEMNIFNLLCLKINQNISYELLSSEVWEGKDVSLSTIRDTISRLKRKVPEINIENIPNYGYILKLDK